MLVKRIVCTVEPHQRRSFHKAQMEWSALRTIEGFLAQFGGWDTVDPSTAYLYSFWENRDRYEDFMENTHDKIFGQSNQGATYTSINVGLFEGTARPTEIDERLRHGVFIKADVINCAQEPLTNERSDGTLLFSDATGRILMLTDPDTAGETGESFMITEEWRVHRNDQ
ncbi:YdbC family protein [Rossellomorea marisflavi]|uniref:YdbC family protein n=1 Tax=Rossellomorea marisflavi TaxID=189381 RepID=UPI003519D4C8